MPQEYSITENEGQESIRAFSYANYKALHTFDPPSVINEADYKSALTRARGEKASGSARGQAEGIAKFSGIDLDLLQLDRAVDPRALYGVLRNDTAPKGVVHHHSQMSDQKLFMEMLCMLEAGEAVRAVKKAYPNIFGV